MDTHPTLEHITAVLEPYRLHDLEDVCQRVRLHLEGPAHPATIIAAARAASLAPLGGDDGTGELTWRVSPHEQGLPWLEFALDYDGDTATFAARLPTTPARLERQFFARHRGTTSAVADYLAEQLDESDRADTWRYLTEDALESARCQEGAARLSQAPAQALLVDAVRQGDLQGAADAVWLGADLNAADALGNRPLHEAAMRGHHELLQALADAGAWVDEPNARGETPLHLAAAKHSPQSCLVLLALGADATRRDHRGRTPLDATHPLEIEHAQGL